MFSSLVTSVLQEGLGDLARLQANTVLSVFHASTEDEIRRFCLDGIDGRKRVGRHYPHWDRGIKSNKGQYMDRGLFVTLDIKVAYNFGRTVMKFKTPAKWLLPSFPSNTNKNDEIWRDYYPKSFRPSLSYNLDPRFNKLEPQALFLGVISPRAIERIYDRDSHRSQTRDQFLASIEKDHNEPARLWREQNPGSKNWGNRRGRSIRTTSLGVVEPQDLNITPNEVVKRYVEQQGAKAEWVSEELIAARDSDDVVHYLRQHFNMPTSVIGRFVMKLKKWGGYRG